MTAVTMQEKTSAPVSVEATKDIVVANIVKTASAKEKPKSAGIQAFEEAGEVNQPTDLIENEDGSKAFMLANGDAYSFGPLGVFFTRRDGSPMPVCGPLEVVAKVRSSEGEDWRLALKWTDQDGHFRQGLIPCSALMKSPAQVVAYLADNGLEIRHAINSQGGSAYIVNFLNRFPVRARVLGVDHHGWVNHGEAFSIPRLGIIGKSETSGIIYTGDPKSEPVYAEKETLTDWQEKIGKPAMFSSRIGSQSASVSRRRFWNSLAKNLVASISTENPPREKALAPVRCARFGGQLMNEVKWEPGVLPITGLKVPPPRIRICR